MIEQVNGDQPALPTIKLLWNATEQTVLVQFEGDEFKNFDIILGILEMAKRAVEQSQRAQMMQALQMQAQAAQQAMQDEAMKRSLGLRHN